MNTPVSGAVSDEKIIAAVGLDGFYSKAECLKIGKRVLALTQPAVPVLASEPLTDSYVQRVPDKCDRIVWRNRYYHLPLKQDAAPQPAPTPGEHWCALEHGGVFCKVCDAAPLASEPEPVAAEQARLDALVREAWKAIGNARSWLNSDQVKSANRTNALIELNAVRDDFGRLYPNAAALASQSTPPPESAGQGLSDAEIHRIAEKTFRDYLEDRNDDADVAFARAILAANRTAQQDGGSKA